MREQEAAGSLTSSGLPGTTSNGALVQALPGCPSPTDSDVNMNAPCSSFSVWSCRQSKVPFMMDSDEFLWGRRRGERRLVLGEKKLSGRWAISPSQGRAGERRRAFQVPAGCVKARRNHLRLLSPSRELSRRLASIYGKAKVPRSSCEEHGRAHSLAG